MAHHVHGQYFVFHSVLWVSGRPTTQYTILVLERGFQEYGIPREILTDDESRFVSITGTALRKAPLVFIRGVGFDHGAGCFGRNEIIEGIDSENINAARTPEGVRGEKCEGVNIRQINRAKTNRRYGSVCGDIRFMIRSREYEAIFSL